MTTNVIVKTRQNFNKKLLVTILGGNTDIICYIHRKVAISGLGHEESVK